MENENRSQTIRKIINYLKSENNRVNDLIIQKENKSFSLGNTSSLKYSIKKNAELIEMLNYYIDGCQIIDRIIDLDSYKNIDDNTIDRYIESLNNSLKIGKKILNYKYSHFFKRYSLDEYLVEIYRNFSDFVLTTNDIMSKEIIKLNNIKKNSDRKSTIDNTLKNDNYMNVKLNKKEIDELKNQFSKNNDQFDSYILSLFRSILEILEKIDSNTIDDELEMMFLLKQNVSEAIYLISISDNDELLAKRNWLLGIYNSAYHNLSNKYGKMNPNDKNDKAVKFEKKHGFSFNIEHYTTVNMLEQSNIYIEKYMIDNKEMFQRKNNQIETKSMADIILNCISQMDNNRIISIYNKMVTEFHNNPNNYYPDRLQDNFVIAIFNLKKNRNEIKLDQELTTEIKNAIINGFCLIDKYMKTNDNLDMPDKKVL